ncbi:hypothetical protein [Sphingobacterium sp. DR205]|uniref:hypothetical protein n=1 Tax=Sphingobacterium sp. DR205 TaxID=2713573 RepID=UPI0013E45BEF|nr:hypothetical protein [Sphingobacterium sp. DR205]QIH32734.1 hypothetical protein G6053_07415 [Sphingobacterium sp. DR205]
MKKSLLYILLISSTTLLCCGSKDDDPVPEPHASESSWKLGTYSYNRGASAQTNTSGLAGISVTTSGDGGNYGAYSGSALNVIFRSSLGAGKYTLTTSSVMSANPNVRYMALTCTVGTAVSSGAVGYVATATSGGTADVTIDANGKYHVNITTPVTLVKTVVTGGGIPGAPSTYNLTVKNAY